MLLNKIKILFNIGEATYQNGPDLMLSIQTWAFLMQRQCAEHQIYWLRESKLDYRV